MSVGTSQLGLLRDWVEKAQRITEVAYYHPKTALSAWVWGMHQTAAVPKSLMLVLLSQLYLKGKVWNVGWRALLQLPGALQAGSVAARTNQTLKESGLVTAPVQSTTYYHPWLCVECHLTSNA